MNYRHIYHAGNFADVFKHIILTRILIYMQRKEQAFRVIDTHAGLGIYDLSSEQAQKTGEWRNGIGRILAHTPNEEQRALIAPWLEVIKAVNDGKEELKRYPGSPFLARQLLRKQDRLTAIELHDHDYKILAARFKGDYQARILHLNGWLALGAHVPPKEKRGLVLVDPPFEKPNEFEHLVDGVKKAYRRFSGGTYALWYPVKDYKAVDNFIAALYQSGIKKILRLELRIRKKSLEPRLDGNGMIIINPPFILQQEVEKLSPFLLQTLAEDEGAKILNSWVRDENS